MKRLQKSEKILLRRSRFDKRDQDSMSWIGRIGLTPPILNCVIQRASVQMEQILQVFFPGWSLSFQVGYRQGLRNFLDIFPTQVNRPETPLSDCLARLKRDVPLIKIDSDGCHQALGHAPHCSYVLIGKEVL